MNKNSIIKKSIYSFVIISLLFTLFLINTKEVSARKEVLQHNHIQQRINDIDLETPAHNTDSEAETIGAYFVRVDVRTRTLYFYCCEVDVNLILDDLLYPLMHSDD